MKNFRPLSHTPESLFLRSVFIPIETPMRKIPPNASFQKSRLTSQLQNFWGFPGTNACLKGNPRRERTTMR